MIERRILDQPEQDDSRRAAAHLDTPVLRKLAQQFADEWRGLAKLMRQIGCGILTPSPHVRKEYCRIEIHITALSAPVRLCPNDTS